MAMGRLGHSVVLTPALLLNFNPLEPSGVIYSSASIVDK
jgi:hypothetical protein